MKNRLASFVLCLACCTVFSQTRPNILFIFADDAGAIAGCQKYALSIADKFPGFVPGDIISARTPNIDQLASDGVLFTNAYCSSPSCSPSRAAILTGQQFFRLEDAGNLKGTIVGGGFGHLFDPKFPLYTRLLHDAGYYVGYAGKAYGPALYNDLGSLPAGWDNPAGKSYGYSTDEMYLEKFKSFLAQRGGKPFCFWLGSRDPHRPYASGHAGNVNIPGVDTSRILVPPYYPVVPNVKNDLADYYWEIGRFDYNVGAVVSHLKSINEYDNTIIVVSGDNGAPFPRAKTNNYRQGTNQPLIVYWKGGVMGGRTINDFVNLPDLAPTFLEAAGITPPADMTAQSLVKLLKTPGSGWLDTANDYRTFAVVGRERHTILRKDKRSYPVRTIITKRWTYIHNYDFAFWPVDSNMLDDVDDGPTKAWMMSNRVATRSINGVAYNLFNLSFAPRPEEELYSTDTDFWEVKNLASTPAYDSVKIALRKKLSQFLYQTGDPRETGGLNWWDDVWTPTYNRFSEIPVTPEKSISTGKPVIVSSQTAGFSGSMAVDTNNATYWSAANSTFPQRLTVDLGRSMIVTKCATRYLNSEAVYKYRIECSDDTITWRPFADRSANTAYCSVRYTDTGRTSGRYVRITTTASLPADTVAICTFNVYGFDPTPVQPVTAEYGFVPPAKAASVRVLNMRGQVIGIRNIESTPTALPETRGIYVLEYLSSGKKVIARTVRVR